MPLAVIIHGTPSKEEYFDPNIPSPSNCHWIPWMQKQLLLSGFDAQTPEMPLAYKPDYQLWSEEFERFAIDEETVLIGHSCGGGFLLRWLSENKTSTKKLILVAPWLDPDRNHCVPGFFDFILDPDLINRTSLHIVYSDNDASDVNCSVDTICSEIPNIHKHLMPGSGHFCNFSQFEELKSVALS